MTRIPVVLALSAAVAVLLSACGTAPGTPTAGPSVAPATSVPSPVDAPAERTWASVTVSVATGSVPPPYNHTWVLSFDPADPASAQLVWRTNYAEEDQEWSTDVALVEDALPAFLELADATVDRSFEPGSLAGGGTYGLRMVDAEGSEHTVSLGSSEESAAVGREITDATRALIPDEDFEELQAEYEAWSAANE